MSTVSGPSSRAEIALGALLGDSEVMRTVRELTLAVAPTMLPVMILGPTGVGKELVARAVHALSGRPGALVCFNAAAVSDSMFEATMFGHVRGAFTGAVSDHPGYLAEADRGSLFLDEVASMGTSVQAKLLRAIETGEYRAVGARANARSQFRLVSAANEDMTALARERRFRDDLLHRLAGVVIEVPSLAERRDDIPFLARHFLGMDGNGHVTLDEDAANLLRDRHWPGNVRELRHVMSLVAALCGTRVTATGLRRALGLRLQPDFSLVCDAPERRELTDALERNRWDTDRTADELGIHRTTLYRRMKRYRLTVPESVERSIDFIG
ncbi:MAG TPA: sigma 54-interacting transcriptional regulator [Gemmatimonadaceae bacterium]